MLYLRTELATDFSEPTSWWQRLTAVDTANPSYRGQYHRIRCWLIEFDDDGNPWREIGLDAQGAVVVAGPSRSDSGFWLDTNMRYADFAGEPVAQEYFERMWWASGVIAARQIR
jgi:hypothetical protein